MKRPAATSLRTLAKHLGVSPAAVQKAVKTGRLKESIGHEVGPYWDQVERDFDRYVATVRELLAALPELLGERLHGAATRDGLAGVKRELKAAVDEVLTIGGGA
jgi:hypothetical protein